MDLKVDERALLSTRLKDITRVDSNFLDSNNNRMDTYK